MLKCRNFVFSFFLVILVQANVHAFQVIDNQTVDVNKTWTIKFTNNVNFDDLTKSSIAVINSKGNSESVVLSRGDDSKSILVKAPQGGYTPGESYVLNVGTKAHSNEGKNLKQIRTIHFNIKSNENNNFNMTKVESNSIKLYYDDDDIKADIRFSRAIENVNCDDFTIAGVKPSSAIIYGSKVTFMFRDSVAANNGDIVTYENGKSNNGPNQTDIIKAAGVNAQLKIVDNPMTSDETGTSIASSISEEQAKVYDYQLAPKTESDYWSATADGKVYITFDTPLDVNSSIKSDDFVFTSYDGTDLNADSLLILGKTIMFTFDTGKYGNYFVNSKQIGIRAKNTVSIRGKKDRDNNYAVYTPSKDDIRNRKITIVQ